VSRPVGEGTTGLTLRTPHPGRPCVPHLDPAATLADCVRLGGVTKRVGA